MKNGNKLDLLTMINHAINNDTVPEVRDIVINYFRNIAEENDENYIWNKAG